MTFPLHSKYPSEKKRVEGVGGHTGEKPGKYGLHGVCVLLFRVGGKNYCTFAVLTGWLFGFLCLVVSIYGKLLKFHRNLFPSFCVSCVCPGCHGCPVCMRVVVVFPSLFLLHCQDAGECLSDLNVCVISLNFCKHYIWYANLCQKYAQNVKVFQQSHVH